MSVLLRITSGALLAMLLSSAVAQDTPSARPPGPVAPAHASSQDLEPSVDTSASANEGTGSHPERAPRAPPAPPAQPPKPAAQTAVGASGGKKGNAKDRIELDTTQITGNRELPKVLYIVPWKHSDLTDLAGRPANSLLDEVLAPVDRDVFQRENRYYGALHPDEPRTGPAPAPGAGRAGADVPRTQDEK